MCMCLIRGYKPPPPGLLKPPNSQKKHRGDAFSVLEQMQLFESVGRKEDEDQLRRRVEIDSSKHFAVLELR